LPARKQKRPTDPVEKDLDAIKRLLIVLLLKLGTSQGEVAKALQTQQSEVSRMFSAGQVRKLDLLSITNEAFWKQVKNSMKT